MDCLWTLTEELGSPYWWICIFEILFKIITSISGLVLVEVIRWDDCEIDVSPLSLWICWHGPANAPRGPAGCGRGPGFCPLLLFPTLLLLVGDHHPLRPDGAGPLQCYLCHHIPGGANRGLMEARDLRFMKVRPPILQKERCHPLTLQRWQKWTATSQWIFEAFLMTEWVSLVESFQTLF